MYHRSTNIRLLALLMFLISCFSFSAQADTVPSAPLKNGNSQNGMVRVRLLSLGTPSSLKLTISGSYTVNGQSSRTLTSGSAITVKYAGGRLSLTANGATADMGTSFQLRRHETSGSNGIKIAQGRMPGNLYPGDFTFTIKGGTLYIVASIYMEDYLYGVLPYEMGDSSGLEALKAQAVAARTYTLRAMSSRSSQLYDVVDTTADQVYNGTPSGNLNCKQAVDATKGIVVKNGSAFTATYYTASNGGQIESIKNAWGTSGLNYLAVKDDPFDLANPAATKKTFTVNASGKQSNAKLNNLLNQKAAAAFGADAVITAVTDVTAHTPMYAEPSKLYTKLTFSVNYTAKGQSWTGALTFGIFSELESALGMSINSLKNELWSVERTASGFTVTARRFGHGIGMSQRGAMQMAKQGYTYDQILGFYYEGCNRVQYTLNRSILSPVVSGQASQEQVIAERPADIEISPAPASTSTPAQDGVVTARVDTPQGSLNLRSAAKDTSKVLRTIQPGETVSVLEKMGTWSAVSYDGIDGYVMTKFLNFHPSTPAPASTPAPDITQLPDAAKPAEDTPAPAAQGLYAYVTTPQGSLKLRKAAQENGKILLTIPQNAGVTVVKKNVKWTKVTYGDTTGFVMTKFLTFTDTPVQQPALPAAPAPASTLAQKTTAGSTMIATVNTKSGSLYLRKTMNGSAKILASIPQGEKITLLSKGSKWCKTTYNGKTGYVMTKFLSFSAAAAAPAPVTQSLPASDTLTALKTAVLGRIVSQNGRKLNLRETCASNARILKQMPTGDTLTITAVGDTWCAVQYQNLTGYCMKEYLEFTLYE
ncbi:MAG: SpoIID/LytB domain-containing protein [Clostridia bacterium]|nr:SpoIID/LytB domain-containing protein [Clostridia bacterium]